MSTDDFLDQSHIRTVAKKLNILYTLAGDKLFSWQWNKRLTRVCELTGIDLNDMAEIIPQLGLKAVEEELLNNQVNDADLEYKQSKLLCDELFRIELKNSDAHIMKTILKDKGKEEFIKWCEMYEFDPYAIIDQNDELFRIEEKRTRSK